MTRYQVITAYADCTSKTESTNDLMQALNAVSIYWMDEDCVMIHVYDWQTEKDVVTYNRP